MRVFYPLNGSNCVFALLAVFSISILPIWRTADATPLEAIPRVPDVPGLSAITSLAEKARSLATNLAKKGKGVGAKKGKTAGILGDGSEEWNNLPEKSEHQVYMMTLEKEDILSDFRAAKFRLWSPPRNDENGKSKLAVLTKTQAERDEIEAWIKKHDIQYEIGKNIQKLIESAGKKKKGKSTTPGQVTWTAYHNLETVNLWLDGVCKKFSKTVSCEVIGKSVEERDIRLIKISNGDKKPKKQAWFDSIHHAREWITLSFTTYAINELTKNADKYKAILDKYDIYVVPLVNPDGYAYTWLKPANRMWRKNRRPHPKGKDNDDCNGVDLNRNYDFKFQFGPDGEGFSSDPCEESYSGPSGFSEPESAAMRDAILKHKANIEFYYTIHAFGQVMMYAWGYGKEKLPNDQDVERVANCSTEAIRGVYGTDFKSGSSNWVYIYPTSGGTDDWVVKEGGVRKTYTLELRDSQEGEFGFLVPEKQILPAVVETWTGLIVGLNDCKPLDGSKPAAKPKKG